MSYRKTFHVGDSKSALVEVTSKLKEAGFRCQESNEYYSKMLGPQKLSTKRNPLSIISNIEVRVTDQSLRVTAQMDRGLKLFLIILGSIFAALFCTSPFVPNNGMWMILGGNLALWMLLLPIINLAFKAKGSRALEQVFQGL
ncbi:MAG: hypothetical protein ACPGVU_00785 [Limisphaerales bacterium]